MDIIKYIELNRSKELVLPGTFDGHRHGLFGINKDFTLRGIPVDQWIYNKDFIKYEEKLSRITEDETKKILKSWINYSLKEGVATILDISGKKYNKSINKFYKSFGINHLLAQYWANWDSSQEDVKLLILPDESGLNEEAIDVAKSFLKLTDGIIMMHTLESKERRDTLMKGYGQSTIEWLEKNGILNNRIYLVHMNAATEEDFEIVKHYDCHVVLCPAMRQALKNPEPNIPEGINLHFGTDGPIATGNLSLWSQAKIQYKIWFEGRMPRDKAAKLALRTLFNSPMSNENVKIAIKNLDLKRKPEDIYHDILMKATKKGQRDIEIITQNRREKEINE